MGIAEGRDPQTTLGNRDAKDFDKYNVLMNIARKLMD